MILAGEGRLAEAVEALKQAIALNPGFAEAYGNLGDVYWRMERREDACICFRKVTECLPDFPRGHYRRGSALAQTGNRDEALASLERAVALAPSYPDPLAALATLYLQHQEWQAAIPCYRTLLTLQPDSSDACYWLGYACHRNGMSDEAAESFRTAIAIRPDFAQAYVGLGESLQRCGKLPEAVIAFEKAVALDPDLGLAQGCYGQVLLARGFVVEAVEAYGRALLCDPGSNYHHSNLLLAMQYTGSHSPACILEASREWERRHALPRIEIPRLRPHDRIHVGYVSPDFRDHVIRYFIEPLLAAHDHDRFRIFCYADVPVPDAATRNMQGMADCWIDTVRLSDTALAERIVADGIDILVDLAGHTANNRLRLFTCKPAPVQVTWLGYPGTTGLGAMDYRISDRIADPEGMTDDHCREKIVRLSDGFLCYAPPADLPDVAPAPLISEGRITFGSFNNLAKITSQVLATWGKILALVPDARLVLKNRWFCDERTRERCLSLLEDEGVDRTRVTLLRHRDSHGQHLACYGEMDISLDTFPYNGTTTTFESLVMGVPVVTLAGGSHAARVGASILRRIGHEDLVAETLEEYVSRAVALASDPARVKRIRRSLRSELMSSVLCDGTAFARQMEEAYRRMLPGSGAVA
jgi:predicted O-linked N-acetylglucosamine transferase (SPINDLY family)